MFEMLELIAIVGGVSGCLLVSKGKPLLVNIVWSISNLSMILYTFTVQQYGIMGMFIVYELIALFGVYNLRHTLVKEVTRG